MNGETNSILWIIVLALAIAGAILGFTSRAWGLVCVAVGLGLVALMALL